MYELGPKKLERIIQNHPIFFCGIFFNYNFSRSFSYSFSNQCPSAQAEPLQKHLKSSNSSLSPHPTPTQEKKLTILKCIQIDTNATYTIKDHVKTVTIHHPPIFKTSQHSSSTPKKVGPSIPLWPVNPPPPNIHPPEIAGLLTANLLRAWLNHWLPLKRPAIKPVFLGVG